jgi:excisionase family DNA binding protein
MENINQNTPKKIPIRISVSEASRLFGVSNKTIREAIRNQELRYIVVKNRYKISFESLLNWSQAKTRRRNLLSTDGIGQFVEQWKIHNRKFSPNPELLTALPKEPENSKNDDLI